MADSGVKQFTDEMGQAVGEVAQDLKDEVGRSLEQAAQSAAGTPTAQQLQPFDSTQGKQKQLEDQKKLAEARRKIAFWKKTQEEQLKVRQEMKQKEEQRLQQTENKKQDGRFKFFEQKQKKQTVLAPTPTSSIENKSKMAA